MATIHVMISTGLIIVNPPPEGDLNEEYKGGTLLWSVLPPLFFKAVFSEQTSNKYVNLNS